MRPMVFVAVSRADFANAPSGLQPHSSHQLHPQLASDDACGALKGRDGRTTVVGIEQCNRAAERAKRRHCLVFGPLGK